MRNQERALFILGLAIVVGAIAVAAGYQALSTDESGGTFAMFWEREATPDPREPGSVILPPEPWKPDPEPPVVNPPKTEPPKVDPPKVDPPKTDPPAVDPPGQERDPISGQQEGLPNPTRAELKELANLEALQNFSEATSYPRNQYTRNVALCCDAMEVPENEAPREIEEADLVKLEGDILYILNPYRGLIIVDLSDPDDPQVLGTCQVLGNPVEMYVVGTRAYVIVSTNFGYWYRWSWWGWGLWDMAPRYQIGSQLVIVDVSRPTAPTVLREVPIEGFVSDSRRVGEVIYFVSNCYKWYNQFTDTEMQDLTYVMSLNIADPQAIRIEDIMDFPGSSNVIHVTTKYLYVAAWSYTYDGTRASRDGSTDITLVDISDPQGDIEFRDVFTVGGRVSNKYQMDHWGNTFRVVSHFRNRNDVGGESELRTFDVRDPFDVRPLGKLLVDDAGNLMATRFAGERAYTIHLPRSVDPLDVIDLSDPTDPVLCDVFEMPGWVTHMEVRGHRIIALGVDDSEGERNVAVSLFDVSDPWNAVMEDRVRIGGRWAHSAANWDPKALTVLDEMGLVLVPFSSYGYIEDSGRYRYYYGVQLVSFDLREEDLELGGYIEQPDAVTRTRSISGRALSTSPRFLQVSDLSDLQEPQVTATVELCPQLMDVHFQGDLVLELVQHFSDVDCYLEVFPKDRPDLGTPLQSINLGRGIEKWFWQDEYLLVLSTESIGKDSYQATVTRYCTKDPDLIWYRQTVFSVGAPDLGYYYFNDDYYWLEDFWYWDWYWDDPRIESDDEVGSTILSKDDHLYFYRNGSVYILDVSGPRSPILLSRLALEGSFYGLMEAGRQVLAITFEQTSMTVGTRTRPMYNYEVTPIRFYPTYGAYLGRAFDVPGLPVGASEDGRYIYTTSTWYTESQINGLETLNVLWIGNGQATLVSAMDIGGLDKVVICGDSAVLMDRLRERVESDDGVYSYIYSTAIEVHDLMGAKDASRFVMDGYYHHLHVGEGQVVMSRSGDYGIYVLSNPGGEDGPTLYSYQVRPEVTTMRVYGDQLVLVQGMNGYSVLQLHY